MRFRAKTICLYLENGSEKKPTGKLCLKRRTIWNKETRAIGKSEKRIVSVCDAVCYRHFLRISRSE